MMKIWFERLGAFKLAPLALALLLGTYPLLGTSLERTKIKCESKNYQRSTCSVGGRIESIRLAKKNSRSPCVEGDSFGFQDESVWVSKGCGGEFEVSYQASGGGTSWWESAGNQATEKAEIFCESKSYGRNECQAEGIIEAVKLREKKSRAACELGRTYGFDRDILWVDKGCGGKFEVTFKSSSTGHSSQEPDRPWWETFENRETEKVRLRCQSDSYGRNLCVVGGQVTSVRIIDRKSDAPCKQGDSYGFHDDFVWVDKGCDAEFEIAYRTSSRSSSPPTSGGGRSPRNRTDVEKVTCKSEDYRRNVCYMGGLIVDLRLDKTKSDAPCVANSSYGYQEDFVWVDKGCEGEFRITFLPGSGQGAVLPGPSEQIKTKTNLTCSSRNYQLNYCGVNGFINSIRLKKRKSQAPCVEGKSWGYQRDSVWVTDGCVAEFELIYTEPR